jgi:hypothetical protein
MPIELHQCFVCFHICSLWEAVRKVVFFFFLVTCPGSFSEDGSAWRCRTARAAAREAEEEEDVAGLGPRRRGGATGLYCHLI